MATSEIVQTATIQTGERRVVHGYAQVGKLLPEWVPQATGVAPKVLLDWKSKGWLGRRRRFGQRFDWAGALDQVAWLDQLYRWGKVLDGEDAAGGWRLRESPQACRAIRVFGGRWEPFHLDDPIPAGQQFFLVPVATHFAATVCVVCHQPTACNGQICDPCNRGWTE